ncbi:hypothetical protein HYS03_01255, partial [Candidatus Woesebacteria bacterium]|nr:hypothetical protein [Candidatus Woesebacteria bacterium]
MGRVIGIRHRVKKTIDGESRPTQLAILENGLVQLINLKTEDDELDFIATRLLSGDRIVMLLGGSGDNLAYALSNKGQQIDCKVYRISPFVFIKKIDEERDKDQDAHQLAALFIENPELFYEVTSRDRDMIWVIECFRA